MLFVTNRAINEEKNGNPNRNISFYLDNTESEQSVYYSRRDGEGRYTEIGSANFHQELRDSSYKQILLYIHGFSNLPEPHIFPRAAKLQELFDAKEANGVQVVPMIWPSDNDASILGDYWEDQKAADASAFAFARVLEKFMAWRADSEPCIKRINLIAHSMGNRVLRQTLAAWRKYDRPGGLPLIFRNTFLMAADIVNESLERGKAGEGICHASRNVLVYYASDDLALRASKASNLKNKVASRRLGHSGPEDMSTVPGNVYAIDCDNFNTRYDTPTGHSYFLDNDAGESGVVFNHMLEAIQSGRVPTGDDFKERQIILT